jgi:hypothetical protein
MRVKERVVFGVEYQFAGVEEVVEIQVRRGKRQAA